MAFQFSRGKIVQKILTKENKNQEESRDKKSMEEKKDKKPDKERPNYVYEGKNVIYDSDYSIEMVAEKEFSTEKIEEQDETVEEIREK